MTMYIVTYLLSMGAAYYVGYRVSFMDSKEAWQAGFAAGWQEVLTKRRVVLSVAEKFLKEDA